MTVERERRGASATPGRAELARERERRVVAEARGERLHQLYTVSEAVTRATALDEIYEVALGALERAVGSDRASVLLFDPDGVMRFKAWRRLSDGYRRAVEGHSPWSADAKDPQPILVADVDRAPDLGAFRDVILAEGIRSLAFIPLVSRGALLGKFMLYYDAPRDLTEDEVQIAQTIANHVSFGIDRMRGDEEREHLLERERDSRREAETLVAVSRAVSSTLDATEAMRRVARELARLMGADMVGAYLADTQGSELRPIAGYHVPKHLRDAFMQFPVPLRGHPAMERVWADPRPVWTDDVAANPRVDRETVGRFPHQSSLFVPMVGHGAPLGGFFVVWWTRRVAISANELRLVAAIGDQAALAIEKSRLLKRAEDASRAKDEFLAVLSHELRTPLTAMLGWARMLREGRLTREQASKALESIERNTRLQVGLINDLLDVSRIVAGKLSLERRVVNLSAITGEAIDALRQEAEAKGVRLTASLDGSVLVEGDRIRLHQVVVNLVSNAVKFTPAEGQVDIVLSRTEPRARLAVSDTGIGIEPTLLPTIFDRFQQVDRSASRGQGGLGLGLAIVRHLVDLHGGVFSAESEGPGRGATFTVELPVVAGESERLGGWRSTDDAPAGPPPSLRGVRILVVDDDEDSRDFVRAVFEQHGAELHEAASASEALDLLARQHIDVLMTDLAMPGETGYDLLRQVRAGARPLAGGRPVAIALTAYAGQEERERALGAGFQAHIAKPVDPQRLAEVVSESLRAVRAGA